LSGNKKTKIQIKKRFFPPVDVHLFIAQSSCRQRQGDNFIEMHYMHSQGLFSLIWISLFFQICKSHTGFPWLWDLCELICIFITYLILPMSCILTN